MTGPGMRAGVVLPGGTATQQLAQAEAAERAGWDGVFVWEAAYGVDAWTLLAAIAARTERVRLGTMLTPLPWRRPWKVASQVATLDQLSNGRAVRAWLDERDVREGFDVMSEGETPAGDPEQAAAIVRPWRDAGATWWMETRWEMPHDSDERMRDVEARIAAGPPRP